MRPVLTFDNGAILGTGPALVNQGTTTSVLLLDNFVGSNNTALTAHAMNTGPGWTNLLNSHQIEGNAAQGTAASTDNVSVSDAGSATGTGTLTVKIGSDGGGGIVTRAQTGTPGFFMLYIDNPSGLVRLLEYASGSFTVRASAAFTAGVGTTCSLTLNANGTTLTGTISSGSGGNTPGPVQISYSSTDFQSNTKWGIHTYSTLATLNAFEVTNP